MVEVIKSFLNALNLIIILWLLSVKPRHGYGIMKEFEKLTGTSLNPGVVYPLLHKLEDEGLAISKWIKEKNKSKRHYFLTVRGKALLNRFQSLFKERLKVFVESLMVEEESHNPKLSNNT